MANDEYDVSNLIGLLYVLANLYSSFSSKVMLSVSCGRRNSSAPPLRVLRMNTSHKLLW